jgi:uncharacterized protein
MNVVLPVPFLPMMIFTSSRNEAEAVLDCQNPSTSMELSLNIEKNLEWKDIVRIYIDFAGPLITQNQLVLHILQVIDLFDSLEVIARSLIP